MTQGNHRILESLGESIGGIVTAFTPGIGYISGNHYGKVLADLTQDMFTCYKLAKKSYCTSCRQAIDTGVSHTFRQLNYLKGQHYKSNFWNVVHRIKCTSGSTISDICLETLNDY